MYTHSGIMYSPKIDVNLGHLALGVGLCNHRIIYPTPSLHFLLISTGYSHSHSMDQPQDPLARAVMQTSPAQMQARLEVASNPDADAIFTSPSVNPTCEWMPGEVMALVFCFVDAKTLMATIPSVWTPWIFELL